MESSTKPDRRGIMTPDSIEYRIETFNRALKTALKNEDYLKAAEHRDKIEFLKSELEISKQVHNTKNHERIQNS